MTITAADIARYFDSKAAVWDSLAFKSSSEIRGLLARLCVLPGERVLDVACGTGVILGWLAEMCGAGVVGVDISGKMIEEARKKYAGVQGVEFVHADFLEWDGRGFDYAVIYNAYPHFMDPAALSAKLAEVLVPGGRFAILHSHSRQWLTDHHNKIVPPISRVLEPVAEEARWFEPQFDILAAEESEDYYLIIGSKK